MSSSPGVGLGLSRPAVAGARISSGARGSRPPKRLEKKSLNPFRSEKRWPPGVAKSLFPIGGRAKLLARSIVAAQLIVGSALVGVLQDLVRLLNILESGFRVLFLADVRMIFAGELAIGALDLLRARRCASLPKCRNNP